MTKNELIKAVSGATGHPPRIVKDIYEGIMSVITDKLAKGEKVTVPPLGSLCVVTRAAREGRNPQTGEKITIPERKSVKLNLSKALKEKING